MKAVYPGSFDPLTFGHLDIIGRCQKIFCNLTILIANNPKKKYFLNTNERLTIVKEEVKIYPRVEIDVFDGLLVDYCNENNINLIIRGIRPLSDFDYEFEMAMMNKKMNSDVETLFIITDQEFFYIRSSIVKELFSLKANIDKLVPKRVVDILKKKAER